MALKFNRRFNVNRVVKRLVYTILSLYVGGQIITTFGNVMMCTSSAFYTGLSLIGWTVTNSVNSTTAVNWNNAGTLQNCTVLGATPTNSVVTATNGSNSVLSVVGIIAIAAVVLEFVTW